MIRKINSPLEIPQTKRVSVLVSRVRTANQDVDTGMMRPTAFRHQYVSHNARSPFFSNVSRSKNDFWPKIFPEGFARPLDGLDGHPFFFHFNCEGTDTKKDGMPSSEKAGGAVTAVAGLTSKRAREESPLVDAAPRKRRVRTADVTEGLEEQSKGEERAERKYDFDLKIKRTHILKDYELAMIDIETERRLGERLSALSVDVQPIDAQPESEPKTEK